MTSALGKSEGTPPPLAAGRPSPSSGIAGIYAVAFALAFGKWGSYLGVPPLFPIDLLLAAAVVGLLVRGSSADYRSSKRSIVPGALLVTPLLTIASIRLLFGGDYSLVSARDFAPYLYCSVALMASYSYGSAVTATRERAARWVEAALLTHLTWVAVAVLLPSVVAALPVLDSGQALRVFSLRYDTDGMLLGVTAAYYLFRFLNSPGVAAALVTLSSTALMMAMPSRAALLGAAVAGACAMRLYLRTTSPNEGHRARQLLVAGLLPLALVAGVAALPLTTAGAKLLVSVGLMSTADPSLLGGVGTAEARSDAWERVVDHVATTRQEVAGVGFGPNFMQDSGANAALLNRAYDEGVRSPHNYLVGTYARLGLIGIASFGALLFGALRSMHRLSTPDSLSLFAYLYVPAAFVSAVVGVVLETPFAAVPFFWCCGILFSAASRRNA